MNWLALASKQISMLGGDRLLCRPYVKFLSLRILARSNLIKSFNFIILFILLDITTCHFLLMTNCFSMEFLFGLI
jgi:hypothetical protein